MPCHPGPQGEAQRSVRIKGARGKQRQKPTQLEQDRKSEQLLLLFSH